VKKGGQRLIVPCWLPPSADGDSVIDAAPRAPCDDDRRWIDRAAAQIDAGFEKKSEGKRQIAFFGGSIASVPKSLRAALLELAAAHVRSRRAASVRVTLGPADCDDALLKQLVAAKVRTVELDAASFDDEALAASGFAHRGAAIADARARLARAKLEVGLVLRPGLPGSMPGEALRSAKRALEIAPDFVRVYPVLVLAGSRLEHLYESRRYRPLTLEEGVALCRDLLTLFEDAGIPVVRMGFQPAIDLDGGARVLAGPWHPALRAIVDASLWYDRMSKLIADNFRFQKELTLTANPRDESRVRGVQGSNLKRLKEKFRLEKLHLRLDADARPGSIDLETPPAVPVGKSGSQG
jgi:hypothetical protein